MNFKNFEQELDKHILSKGKTYFGAGAVSELYKEDGHWIATVEGTDDYDVSVKGIRTIKEWYCDCPYDHGPICKHVVAVFYAVQDLSKKKSSSKSKKANQVDEIFKKVDPDKLLAFFKKSLRGHKTLKQQLLSEFIEVLNPEDDNRFDNLVDSIIKNTAIGRYGQLDFRAGNQLSKALIRLIDNASASYQKKNYADTFGICAAILTKVPMTLLEIDDSSGSLQNCSYFALDVLNRLYTAPQIAPALLDRIFDFKLDRLVNDKSDYDDLKVDMIRTLLEQNWGDTKLLEAEKIIQKYTNKLTGEYQGYSKTRYVKMLIIIAGKLGDHDKRNKHIESNLDSPDIRRIKLEILLEKEDYDNAISLVEEGKIIAKEKRHPGTVSGWNDELIRISQLRKDVKSERKLLEDCFFSGYLNMKYYIQLKATYNNKDWPEQRDRIIKKLDKNKGDSPGIRHANVSEILVVEKLWDDLLKRIKNKHFPQYLISKFGIHLHKKYPSEMLAIYKPMIIESANQTSSRSEYRKFAKNLKGLLEIKGGKTVVVELLEIFREKHANRPAMMDELSKVL